MSKFDYYSATDLDEHDEAYERAQSYIVLPHGPPPGTAWEWRSSAACLLHQDVDFFRAGQGQAAHVVRCKTICDGCVVRPECLAYALDNNEQYGVWGGKTPNERKAMR